ncbi:hypothetical protein PPERSA_07229 [Pseudocohnilembus persalinus]|uniref:Cytosolic carboxypeptidase N-terminal domain-containing protein n=1 Tax=Pseudocohnilembus persalinus TaxID=266149 RepID=A0A0V0QD15_PSEPJ|nr:hypothetical protein PPERSA_07229 [Pseudocohnilembus persalinus]|eukprot:KRX00032.1 hypothetical protein PPERSA_07229 [Pseudocohnilembus persalinus]
MANVLCDIRPLITNTRNGEQQIVQQYFGQGVASQEKQINRVYNSFFEKERNHILEFSSDFECGNLLMAYKVGPFEYDLVLQNDINTKGYTQWFFFSVGNAKKNTPYTFNIVNMKKYLIQLRDETFSFFHKRF